MSRKSRTWGLMLMVFLLSTPALLYLFVSYGGTPRSYGKGAIYESKLFEGKTVSIRGVAYYEKVSGFRLPGAYLAFEGRPKNSEVWITLFESYHRDPTSLPDACAEFVTDDLAFVYTDRRLAITSDRGLSWDLWDPSRDLPNWSGAAGANASGIAKVTLAPDGTGTMLLKDRDKDLSALLKTLDFGRHWTP